MNLSRKFWCLTCQMQEPLDHLQIAAHVREAHHQSDGRQMKGRKVDRPDLGENVYDYLMEGGEVIREVARLDFVTPPKGLQFGEPERV